MRCHAVESGVCSTEPVTGANLSSIVVERKQSQMTYTDETLICRDCGQEFVFTSGEQEFFASRGLQNKPSRCPECRAAAKAARGEQVKPRREMFEATCGECGQPARVPFEPRLDKPVYCSSCFDKVRSASYS